MEIFDQNSVESEKLLRLRIKLKLEWQAKNKLYGTSRDGDAVYFAHTMAFYWKVHSNMTQTFEVSVQHFPIVICLKPVMIQLVHNIKICFGLIDSCRGINVSHYTMLCSSRKGHFWNNV